MAHNFGSQSPLRSSRTYHNRLSIACNTELLVIVIWIVNLIFFEHIYFHLKVSQCDWPDNYFKASKDSDSAIRIALIGDPQLIDRYSYDWGLLSPFKSILSPIIEFYSDIYMRKNFQLLQIYHQPKAIFVLGDLLESGREISDEEFKNEVARYNWVFESTPQEIYRAKSKKVHYFSIPKFNLTGNHDIGYNIDKDRQEHVTRRFEKEFGPLNYEIFIDNISFVVISSTLLEKETTNEKLFKETDLFLQEYESASKLSNNKNTQTPEINPVSGISKLYTHPLPGFSPSARVLFHHTPLYRPPNTYCGDERNRNPSITDRIGYSYRNMLDSAVSKRLIEIFRPFLTFSGDDHDYCKIQHTASTVEHTIGTFSWLEGNKFPSFALLSIQPPRDSQDITYDLTICYTPSQLYIYYWYILLGIASIAFLLIDPLNPSRRQAISLSDLRSVSRADRSRIRLFRAKSFMQRISYHLIFLAIFYIFLVWETS